MKSARRSGSDFLLGTLIVSEPKIKYYSQDPLKVTIFK